MSIVLTEQSSKSASVEELAQSILDNADSRPMSASFMRVAAVELAKRIIGGNAATLPDDYVSWSWRPVGSGEAEPRMSEKRGDKFMDEMFGGKS